MSFTFASATRSARDQLISAATRPFLQRAERRVLRQFRRSDLKRIPIVINNRNRLSCMVSMVEWLTRAGFENIWIVDNDSTYPPLLSYYEKLPSNVTLARLRCNIGPRALYDTSLYWKLCRSYYVLSDPDIVPVNESPLDAIEHFFDLLQRYPFALKAGFGLKIDDLPEHYARREKVMAWETRFWTKSLEPGVYDAILDTTFALYRPWVRWRHGFEAVRTGNPYVARHVPWYSNSASPDAEEQFYEANVRPGASWWVGRDAEGQHAAERRDAP